jgi:N-methylhydantoinase B
MLRMDAIDFEVMRNALNAATDEAAFSLQRSAYSTNVKTRLDYSCGLFDRRCRLIAQSFSQPGHLGILPLLVPKAIEEFGVENLQPGDGILVNDPHRGTTHFNDIYLISPIHYENRLVGYIANAAHHVDVGGGAVASLGAFTESYQEGLCIPVVKFVSGGEIVDDIQKMILANVRAVAEVTGDLRAQIACNTLGSRRVSELLDRFGEDRLATCIDELLEYTRRRTEAAIAELPDGVFSAEAPVDDDGLSDEPILLKLSISIDGSALVFDFEGTDAQRSGPMNATMGITSAVCYCAARALMDPDIPVNGGFYDAIDIRAPSGTCVNANPPAACVGAGELVNRVGDMACAALAHVLPHKVAACSKSSICNIGFGGVNPRTGAYYAFMETVAGGFGARQEKDGPDAVQPYLQNSRNAPIEELELNYPVEILDYSLVTDSDGPGFRRGGLGVRRKYRFVDHEPSFTFLADRARFPPWGILGGFEGRAARYYIERAGERIDLPSKTTFTVVRGDVVCVETAGGGGFGDPFEREPCAVLDDVVTRKISADRAREWYGVVLHEGCLEVDDAATLAHRRLHAPGSAPAAPQTDAS